MKKCKFEYDLEDYNGKDIRQDRCIGKEQRICSVSYTHLDVYKRQAVCNAVSSGYKDFKAIAIVGGLNSTGINGITYPCGICLSLIHIWNIQEPVVC